MLYELFGVSSFFVLFLVKVISMFSNTSYLHRLTALEAVKVGHHSSISNEILSMFFFFSFFVDSVRHSHSGSCDF